MDVQHNLHTYDVHCSNVLVTIRGMTHWQRDIQKNFEEESDSMTCELSSPSRANGTGYKDIDMQSLREAGYFQEMHVFDHHDWGSGGGLPPSFQKKRVRGEFLKRMDRLQTCGVQKSFGGVLENEYRFIMSGKGIGNEGERGRIRRLDYHPARHRTSGAANSTDSRRILNHPIYHGKPITESHLSYIADMVEHRLQLRFDETGM